MDPLPLRFSFKQTSAIEIEPPQFPFFATFSLAGGWNWMSGWEKLWSVFKLICTLSVKWFCIISSSQDLIPSYTLEDLLFFSCWPNALFLQSNPAVVFSTNLLAVKSVKQLVCNGDRSKAECRTKYICSPQCQGKAGPEFWGFDPSRARTCRLTNTLLAKHSSLWLLHQYGHRSRNSICYLIPLQGQHNTFLGHAKQLK